MTSSLPPGTVWTSSLNLSSLWWVIPCTSLCSPETKAWIRSESLWGSDKAWTGGLGLHRYSPEALTVRQGTRMGRKGKVEQEPSAPWAISLWTLQIPGKGLNLTAFTVIFTPLPTMSRAFQFRDLSITHSYDSPSCNLPGCRGATAQLYRVENRILESNLLETSNQLPFLAPPSFLFPEVPNTDHQLLLLCLLFRCIM